MFRVENRNGQKVPVLPNGKPMSPLCFLAVRAVLEPGFFPTPSPARIQTITTFLTFAETAFDQQIESKQSRTAEIHKSAVVGFTNTLNQISAGIIKQNTMIVTNFERFGKESNLPARDFLVNTLCYLDLAIHDVKFIKKESEKNTKGNGFPKYKLVFDQVRKAFHPEGKSEESKLFKHFNFQVITQADSKTMSYVSRTFTTASDANKYLAMLQKLIPSACLDKIQDSIRLKVPDLEQRLEQESILEKAIEELESNVILEKTLDSFPLSRMKI